MVFEFNVETRALSAVEIEELGNFGLEASNDEGYYYYMAVKCFLGTSVVVTCGPVIPDLDILPSGFSMTLEKMPSKEEKLTRCINTFLNDGRRKLTDARLMTFEEAVDNFKEMKDYLLHLQEDTF